ncbi:MAG: hypothetical protein FWG47_03515 [Propionibacteriaceae bacterium]|nr:hypothetical protein [Propionibacteriaceae bacterium]
MKPVAVVPEVGEAPAELIIVGAAFAVAGWARRPNPREMAIMNETRIFGFLLTVVRFLPTLVVY